MDDVIVVGAGPAGSLAAIILARAGLRVTMFDRARFPRPKLCGDTVNPGGWRVLEKHLPIQAICDRANPIDGMLLTGPGGVAVRGLYGDGIRGFAIERRRLDTWLVEHAIASGAHLEQGCLVDRVVTDGTRVTGVQIRTAQGQRACHARLVIAADGRHSRLAFGLGLARHPQRPRRWAIGAYFEEVGGLTSAGEMHVRRGHYLGIAPMPGGLANACLVLPHSTGDGAWGDPAAALMKHVARDPDLAGRFARARMVETPVVLGPMAVDRLPAHVPGLLVAGDASGFIDPMTGDGLTLAWRGAELAAAVAIETLAGTVGVARASQVLVERQRRAFGTKWQFNRALRRLVASSRAVTGAALAARLWPGAFQSMIRYAGDAACTRPF